MGWSNKYKKSINCDNPKGFSQKAHCKGRKKRNENIMKLSEFREAIRNVLRERSINAIRKAQDKNLSDIEKALEFYKKNKHTDKKEPFIKVLKKLGKEKERLAKELDDKVSGMYKNAEYKGESVNENRFLDALKDFFRKEEPTFKQMAKRYKKKADFIKWFVKSQAKMGVVFKNDGYGAYMMNRMGKLWDRVHGQPEDKKYVGESINEGPSTEEKRIAMLAVRKQAKYRNVSLEQAIQDQINALEELKRDAKRGKLK